MTLPISVIIPTFNSSKFLGEALDSVCNQTVLPCDLVVVDDASTDGTCEIVETFARKAPFPVQLVRLAINSGSPVRPMNTAFKLASGKFVTILDHDDILVPAAVEVCLNALTKSSENIAIISTDFQQFDCSGTLVDSLFARCPLSQMLAPENTIQPLIIPPDVARNLLATSWCLPMKGAVAKVAWESVGGFSERYRSAWDCDFVWRVTKQYGIAVINSQTVRVRVHGGNLSRNHELVGRELINIYSRMISDVHDKKMRTHLKSRLSRELFDLSYEYYRRGRLFRAATSITEFLFKTIIK